jgi:GH25 family lysozyme M1 (1,4-beta-N-acetylmuramidase)
MRGKSMRLSAAVLLALALSAPTLLARASSTAQPSPSPPSGPGGATVDSPALPHGVTTQQQLAGGRQSALATASGWPLGIDVASYQHPGGAGINWGQVAAAGYRFAFIKGTQGNYYTNPYFASDYQAAAAAGMFRSAYHFADPSVSDGVSQADYLLAAAPYAADGHTLPPAVDLEDIQGPGFCYGLSPGQMIAWITAFSNEIQARTGRAPIIYTRASWWNQCTGGSSAFANNPLWVANYGVNSPTLPAGWGTWTFWQWTSSGSVPGISGSVDVSYFNGSDAGLGSFAGWLRSGAAVSSWASNRLDLFWADGLTAAVFHRWGDGSTFQGYDTLGGLVADGTEPAAVSWGPNRIDVFVCGVDGQLWHAYWDGASWRGWEPLGGLLTATPAVTSWASGRLDIFVRGADHAMWHRFWDQNGWSGWERLGGQFTSGPTAESRGPGVLDVFAAGTDRALWSLGWNASGWSGWYSLGGLLTHTPGAVSWSSGRIDVFVDGIDNALWHLAWGASTGWSGWQPLGGALTSGPAAVSRGVGLIDVFVRSSDLDLWRTSWNGSAWSAWQWLGG